MDIEKFLSSVEVFSKLEPDLLTMLAGHVEIKKFAEDYIVVEQGVQGEYLWIVYQGSVKVFQETPSKKKILLATLFPSDIFGEISLISKSQTTAEVVVEVPSVLLMIPQEVVLSVINKDMTTNAFFSRTLIERITDSVNKQIDKG